MPPPAVSLSVHGQYDQAYEVTVAPDGTYEVVGGTYVTRGRSFGWLTAAQRTRLHDGLAALTASRTYPIPAEADGFISELRIEREADPVLIRWWGPPPEDDPALTALLRLLRSL